MGPNIEHRRRLKILTFRSVEVPCLLTSETPFFLVLEKPSNTPYSTVMVQQADRTCYPRVVVDAEQPPYVLAQQYTNLVGERPCL